MKRRGDKTHPCLRPTPTWNNFDCLSLTRTQNSICLAVGRLNGKQQLTINAILLQNTPKFISRNSGTWLFEVNKASKEVFAVFPRFLKDFLQSKNLVRGAVTWMKTALSILLFRFHYFTAFPFKAFDMHFSWQTKKWYSSVVCALLAITFLEYWDDQSNAWTSGSSFCLIVGRPGFDLVWR